MSATSLQVALAMGDLQRDIAAEGRLRTITGEIFDRMTTRVAVGEGFVVGQLETDDYWRFVGSGRGPGKMPPVASLQAWIDRSGATVSAWALAKSIAKHGTRDWRLKKPNVFLSAIEAWEQGPAIGEVEEVAGGEFEELTFDVLKKNIKGNG